MRNVRKPDWFKKRPRLLSLAALAVALLYIGVALWVMLSDGHFAGEPVVRIALETPVAKTPADAGHNSVPDMEPATSGTVEPSDTPGDPDQPNEDEQSLLDAAAGLNGDGVTITGAQTNDNDAAAREPLSPVPDPALVEKTKQGPLPIISKSGAEAWRIYARPLQKPMPAGPRIAIIVSGMGISESATQHAIDTLPSEVTLSFAPYGGKLQSWIAKARDAGHEVLLEIPMEPFGYPQNDPGPYTLLTNLTAAENIKRLEWLMSRFSGYAGVMNYQGARFSTSQSALAPAMAALKARGLMYVDNGTSQRSLAPQIASDTKMPFALANRMIDPVQNPDVIDKSLAALEASAKANGSALGVASAFPITVDEVTEWAKDLRSRGFILVPATSIAAKK